MLHAVLTMGASASGKSTFVHKYYSHYTEINRDNVRIETFMNGDESQYHHYVHSHENEYAVTKIVSNKLKKAVNDKKNIVLSDTHLHIPHIKERIHYLKNQGYCITVYVFELPFVQLKKRNQERVLRQTPLPILKAQHKKLSILLKGDAVTKLRVEIVKINEEGIHSESVIKSLRIIG
ncbi:AAA family ATPase [Vibrio sp.]|nr:AAA family ATPase [Vibrio sp.]